MGQWLKHLAVRFWTALLTGGLAALLVLPFFVDIVGPGWMIVPGLCLFVAAFWATGAVFAAMGRRRLGRLLGEAAVWERAGMAREALQVLARAQTTVDSFLFSPLSKKPPAAQLLVQLARFQLARGFLGASSDPIIDAYLRDFPHDRDAAVKWLDGLLAGKAATQTAHDISARIGAAHPEDGVVQRMLAQFYLAERRCDFAALQTYGQLVADDKPIPEDLLNDLADLFLAHQRADRLALQVYLDLHERGIGQRRLLPGIAACALTIHPGSLTRPMLERAGQVLAGIDAMRRRDLAADFLSQASDAEADQPPQRRRITGPALVSVLRQTAVQFGGWTVRAAIALSRLLGRIRRAGSSKRTRSALKWSAMTLFVGIVGWLVVNTAMHLGADMKIVQPTPEPVAAAVTDPFTLQVAAYLKEADARRYAEQLKGHGLDAYWTRASGTNKTWYQVRISHYATKEAARAIGEELKGRQLIADYYVANYKRPEVP